MLCIKRLSGFLLNAYQFVSTKFHGTMGSVSFYHSKNSPLFLKTLETDRFESPRKMRLLSAQNGKTKKQKKTKKEQEKEREREKAEGKGKKKNYRDTMKIVQSPETFV